MSKVNLVLDVPDNAMDDAVLQIVKNRVRSFVAQEEGQIIQRCIENVVASHVSAIAQRIENKYNWFAKEGEAIKAQLLDRATEMAAKAKVEEAVEQIVTQYRDYMLSQLDEASDVIEDLVNRRVDAVLVKAVTALHGDTR